MALVTHRDPAALRDGLARWFAARHELGRGASRVRIDGLDHPSTGYSSETVLVDVSWSGAGGAGSASLVVRMAPPTSGTFFDYDVAAQTRAQRAAAAAGVPIAEPLVLETDPSWVGAAFLVMPRVAGHVVGESAAHDPWVVSLEPAQQRRLHTNFLDALAAVHRADWQGAGADGDGAIDAIVPRRDNAAELDHWARYLDRSSNGAPLPALVEALAWCRDHAPDDATPPVLLWGDVRPGNTIVGDDLEVRAVLDWDMSTIGAPEHDLAWLTTLESTMAELSGSRVPGFLDRAGVVAHYERAAGRVVRDFEWYETFALLRSTAIMARIGYLRRDAGRSSRLMVEDNPVVALLLRRIGA